MTVDRDDYEFFGNVDAWGAAEWFDRLARAVKKQDEAVVAHDEIGIETYRNIVSSSAMRLVRDFGPIVSRALSATEAQAEPVGAKWHDVGYLMSIIDSAIEDGFDPDEDGPLLDEIRAELKDGSQEYADGSDLQMPSDWRVVRDAIEAAYAAMGETRPDNIPDRDWQLAGLVIAANQEALRRTCAECKKKIELGAEIVCLDCKCALHAECAPRHFWPNGRPKPLYVSPHTGNGGVEVEPLEWQEILPKLWGVDTALSSYRIHQHEECRFGVSLDGDSLWYDCVSLDAAKAAAQSDYQTRLRAALVRP